MVFIGSRRGPPAVKRRCARRRLCRPLKGLLRRPLEGLLHRAAEAAADVCACFCRRGGARECALAVCESVDLHQVELESELAALAKDA